MSSEEQAVAVGRADRIGLPAWIMARANVILMAAVLLAVALKLFLVFRLNIHWDEFYFLSQVHDYLRGALSTRLQTFHVHFFSWLPIPGTDEIDQIVAGRLVMWTCLAASAFLIYGIARRFASHGGALFAVLAYLSVSAIIDHGASFRTDPIATVFSLLSFYLLLCRPGGSVGAALAGCAMAVAMLVTIKSVFHLVALSAAFLWLAPGFRTRAVLVVMFAGVFGAIFYAGYLWHGSTLPELEASAAPGFLSRTASKMLLEDGLAPRWKELLTVVVLNPLFWFMTVMGAATAWGWIRSGRDTGQGWMALALALPLLTPLFYRNAFLYFYVFILPAASLLVGIFYDRCAGTAVAGREARQRPLAFLLVLAQCALFLANYALRLPDRVEPQRETLAAIHAAFPDPVPYIGGYGIVSTMPRVGFFMSGWGMNSYRKAGRPVFADLVAKRQPPLLLADAPVLNAVFLPDWEVDERYALLPADTDYLQDNYLPYWGMVFIAGKRLRVPVSTDVETFEMAVSAEYRLDSAGPTVIDGLSRQPGDVIMLGAGRHILSGESAGSEVILRWAKAPPPPQSEPVDLATFFDLNG